MSSNKTPINLHEINKPELLEQFTDFKIIETNGLNCVRIDYGQITPCSSLNLHPANINQVLIPFFYPPKDYILPTHGEVQGILQKMHDWLIEEGLAKEFEKEQLKNVLVISRDVTVCSYLCNLHKKCGIDNCWKIIALGALWALIDDIMEETDIFSDPKDNVDYFGKVKEILLESDGLDKERIEILIKKMPPILRPLTKVTFNLFFKLKVLGSTEVEQISFRKKYLMSIVEYFARFSQAHSILKIAFDENELLPESVFRYLQIIDGGFIRFAFETCSRFCGVSIGKNIEESIVFKHLESIAEQLLSLVNDLVGLKHDLCTVPNLKNFVVWRAKNLHISLENATVLVVEDVQKLAKEFNFMANKFLQIFEGSEEAKFTIEHSKMVLDVAGYLCVYLTRYGNLREFYKINNP